VASIDWSQDGRFIVVCFKVDVQIAIWDVVSCQKILHLAGADLDIPTIQCVNFTQSNRILVTGDKAVLVTFDVNNNHTLETIIETAEQPELQNNESQANLKKKTQRFPTYISAPLVNGHREHLLIANNYHKLILLITKRPHIVEAPVIPKAE
jgi:WD40 repeat protein